MEQKTEQELMKEVMADGFQAFTLLYNKYKHTLYQFILRLSHGDSVLAEEVVQETFLLLWEHRRRIHVETSFEGYVKRVSRNLFLRETYKRVQNQLVIAQLERTEEAENLVDNEVELHLLMEEIERIVSMLPPARQRVYRMKHMEHLSQKEISERLGITENTVETHLKQSRKFLTLMLKSSHGDWLSGLLLLLHLFTLL